MKSGETYIFTLRTTLKDVPRITQERVYVTPYEYKLISSFDLIFSAEKEKDKKADKTKLKLYKEELYKISYNKDKHEVFTDNSVYANCLNKTVETKEGFRHLKLK